jgi:hypothetical protein
MTTAGPPTPCTNNCGRTVPAYRAGVCLICQMGALTWPAPARAAAPSPLCTKCSKQPALPYQQTCQGCAITAAIKHRGFRDEGR